MKKWFVVVFAVVLLAGCGAQQTFETVDDVFGADNSVSAGTVKLSLPEEAATPVMESNAGGSLYLCDGYDLTVQTMDGGDLDRTLLQMTGYPADALQCMKTKPDGITRYDLAWTSAGEDGDLVARGVVLDDGAYHYVVTVMADAQVSGSLRGTWETLLESVSLVSTD